MSASRELFCCTPFFYDAFHSRTAARRNSATNHGRIAKKMQLCSDAAGCALVLEDGSVWVWGQIDASGHELTWAPCVLSQTPRPLDIWLDALGRPIDAERQKALSAEVGNYHAAIVSEDGDLYTVQKIPVPQLSSPHLSIFARPRVLL